MNWSLFATIWDWPNEEPEQPVKLTGPRRWVLLALAKFAGDHRDGPWRNVAWPSWATLAANAGVSKATAKRQVARCIEDGLVRKVPHWALADQVRAFLGKPDPEAPEVESSNLLIVTIGLTPEEADELERLAREGHNAAPPATMPLWGGGVTLTPPPGQSDPTVGSERPYRVVRATPKDSDLKIRTEVLI